MTGWRRRKWLKECIWRWEGGSVRRRPKLRWIASVKAGIESKLQNIEDAKMSVHDRDRLKRAVCII